MSISRDTMIGLREGSITIHTDGCRKKSGEGGWCSIIEGNGFVKLLGGHASDTTNNKMELEGPVAALSALSHLKGFKSLYTDSSYVVDGFNSWMSRWARKRWRLKNGDPVKNLEYWIRLYDLQDNTMFHWVRSHNGHLKNELCDTFANVCCAHKLTINESFFNMDELQFYIKTFKNKT